jgi:hypothetical protein
MISYGNVRRFSIDCVGDHGINVPFAYDTLLGACGSNFKTKTAPLATRVSLLNTVFAQPNSGSNPPQY